MSNKAYLLAFGSGAGAALALKLLHSGLGIPQSEVMSTWFGAFYAAFILLSLIVAFNRALSAWRWGLILMLTYGLLIMALIGTQVPVFEIPLILLMSLPLMGAAKIGSIARRNQGEHHV